MKPTSFRLKLALFTGLLAGVLSLLAGAALWRISHQFHQGRLDREIRSLGQSNLDRVQGGDHWARLEEALRFVAGNRETTAYILWVKHNDRVIYRSPGWPDGMPPEDFPVAEVYEGPDAPLPGAPLPPPPRRGEEISPRNPALPLKAALFHTREAGGRTWRLGVMGNPYVTLVLGADMGDFHARMTELGRAYIAVLGGVLLLGAGGSWLVARRALRPVTALTRLAEGVTARGLDQRIPPLAADAEFHRLITVFNAMLDRLERSFRQATRFSADASHELRTPLALLQVELEQALQHAPPGSPQEEIYASLGEEVSRLSAIVQKLLLLALADAGRLELRLEPVDLGGLLAGVIEDCRAQATQIAVEEQVAPGVRVMADPALLEQAMRNLSGNALKHNHPGGRIRFELTADSGRARLRVSNTGPGIPAADVPRLFERFYRGDPARTRGVGGVGLGLSLSREIVRAHGGELLLEDSTDGITTFRLELPLAVAAGDSPDAQPRGGS